MSTAPASTAASSGTITAPPAAAAPSPGLPELKARLKATWMDGNYDYFSRFMASSADQFLDDLPVGPGTTLLDVACGSGQLALAAASRGARVTGVDIAANWIEAARGRARAAGADARFDEGDAEQLPYGEGAFDVVATLFGAMFAPRPEAVATELLRVCRPGGTVAMANWTKEGFVGRMFAIFAKFIAPAGMPSPVLWGSEPVVADRLGHGLSPLEQRRVLYRFDYPFGPSAVVDFFRSYYGPTTRAFAALGEADRAALHEALTALWTAENQSSSPSRTIVDAEYLQVIGTRA